jgi:hypothetical protein
MSIEDVVLIATVREEIRKLGSFFNKVGIERRIEAARVRMVDGASDDASSVCSESGAAEKEPPKEAVTGTGANLKADSYNSTKEVAVAITSKALDTQGSNEHPVSPCVVWLVSH